MEGQLKTGIGVVCMLTMGCHDSQPCICWPLDLQVRSLQERLAAAEAEIAEQLAAKEEAQQLLGMQAAQLQALRCERELLQEQAVSLQQEASGIAKDRLLRGSVEVLPMERSPSRTLTQRVKELLSPRRQSPSRSGSSLSMAAGSGSHPASPTAMPMVAEGGESPLQGSAFGLDGLASWELRRCQQQVEALQGALQAKEAERQVQKVEAAAALAMAQQRFEAELGLLKGRMEAAEAAAEAVLQHHGSPKGAPPSPGVASNGMPTGSSHQKCREAIEGLYSQARFGL